MAQPSQHLSDWTLEQLAEGVLPTGELEGATAHVAACGRCAAELEAHRTLYAALESLPRFAPSAQFADAVMARVRIPEPSPVWLWLQRWMPSTRRGWVLLGAALAAPAAALVALLGWLLSQPLVSSMTLWQWAKLTTRSVAETVLSFVIDWGVSSGVFGWIQQAYQALLGLPTQTLTAGLVALAIAIPLSAWALYRLVRTPMRNVTYAN